MANNHLEQLVSEWYEYQGYFIRRNVKVGKRSKVVMSANLILLDFTLKSII